MTKSGGRKLTGSGGVPATATAPTGAEVLTGNAALFTTSKFAPRQNPAPPSFTLDDVRKAIPAHCFERPWYKSFGYLTYDVIMVTIMFVISLYYKQIALKAALNISNIVGLDTAALGPLIQSSRLATVANPASLFDFGTPADSLTPLFGESTSAFFSLFSTQSFSSASVFLYSLTLLSLWVFYVIVQGAIMTGLWVLGHECGHKGFSASATVANAVGVIVHSFLLVPYFSWQTSHRKHHSHTGDMELDEVHLPEHINALVPSASYGYLHNDKYAEQESQARAGKPVNGAGSWIQNTGTFLKEVNGTLQQYNFVFRTISFVLITTVGWFLYLVMNASGRRYAKTGVLPPNHFVPSSPIFTASDRVGVIVSNVVLSAYLYAFYLIAAKWSFGFFALTYIAPYFVVNYWLVVITLLQHTHTGLPHYSTASWTYLRGALATVDRDFGAFYNFTLHNINDTHVVHHLFSTIPHYHAMEATRAVQKLLDGYYIKTDTEAQSFGVLKSLWTSLRECNFVAEDEHPALELTANAINSLKTAGATDASVQVHSAVPSAAAAKTCSTIITKTDTELTQKKSASNAPKPLSAVRDINKEVYWFRTVHTN